MNDDQNQQPNPTERECARSNRAALNPGVGAALGAGIGAALGTAMGNIAVGVGVGVALGAAVGILVIGYEFLAARAPAPSKSLP